MILCVCALFKLISTHFLLKKHILKKIYWIGINYFCLAFFLFSSFITIFKCFFYHFFMKTSNVSLWKNWDFRIPPRKVFGSQILVPVKEHTNLGIWIVKQTGRVERTVEQRISSEENVRLHPAHPICSLNRTKLMRCDIDHITYVSFYARIRLNLVSNSLGISSFSAAVWLNNVTADHYFAGFESRIKRNTI